MIRDIILSSVLCGCLGLTFRYPYVGVLTWTWLAIMQPHREVYGVVSNTLRLNFIVAFATIAVWFFSKERKLPPVDGTLAAVLMFLAWMTFSNVYVDASNLGWVLWDRAWKILALGLIVGATANTKERIHALMWMVMLALVYYGGKGGLLTLMTGGAKRITGPPDTLIGDNNQLALTLLMILPIVNYLRVHSANKLVRLGVIVLGLLTFLSVIGSYSRGAYVALAALCFVGWVRARNKLIYPILLTIVAVPALMFMPQSFYDRAATLQNAGDDPSFQGRVQAWHVAYYYARDHFPFGAGFSGTQFSQVYNYYFPGASSHAAHSIYFQVLGDHGFMGLAIFLTILFLALLNTQRIRKAARNRPEFKWAYDLATMIQLSIIAYCVGGAALSMAYDDMFAIWAMLLPVLRNMVTGIERNYAGAPSPHFAAVRQREGFG